VYAASLYTLIPQEVAKTGDNKQNYKFSLLSKMNTQGTEPDP
jgi:hypothetical protein